VRIDPTNRPETQNRLTGANTPEQAVRPDSAELTDQTARIEVADAVHQSYIRKAAASQDLNAEAIAEARKLIEAGQLDTPEAIAKAAENIIDKGI